MRLHIIAPTYNPRVVAGAGLALVKLTTRLFDRFPDAVIYLNRETAKAFPEWSGRIVTVSCGDMASPFRKALTTLRLQLFGFPEFPRNGVCWFPFGPIMPLGFRGRGIATIHDTLELDQPSSVPLVERIFRAIVMPRTVQKTQVVTISRFSKQRLEHHYKIRPRVIEWGIDPMRKGSDLRVPRQRYVFYPANAYVHKNHRFLLDLWVKEPRLRGVALVLTAGGGTSPLDGAIKRARAAGVTVIVTGRVSNDELTGLYRNSDCTVLPTLYEGYGLPMRESLLCRCPVIANSECEALHETVRENYPFFVPLEPELWVQAILSSRGSTRNSLPEFVVPRSWNDCAAEYTTIFQEISNFQNTVPA